LSGLLEEEWRPDVPITDNLGKRYGAFGRWRIAAEKMEVLLVVNGLDMDRSA
jgi:hypothetical protein